MRERNLDNSPRARIKSHRDRVYQHMIKFGLTNFRRFERTGLIELKPITLLLGRNSSGKSSFLRSIPLLKQSLMTRTRSPILWWGDFVDFGSFEGAVHVNDPTKTISFDFEIENLPFRGDHYARRARQATEIEGVHIRLNLQKSGSTERISGIELRVEQTGDRAALKFAENDRLSSFEINGKQMFSHLSRYVLDVDHGQVFPFINVSIKNPDAGVDSDYVGSRVYMFGHIMEEFLKGVLHGHTSKEKINRLAQLVQSSWPLSAGRLSSLVGESATQSWKRLIAEIREDEKGELYRRVSDISFASNVLGILRDGFDLLSDMLLRSLYIGPARARSERYYRYQDLAVSEIDADGKNFPMFLNSLGPGQLRDLSEWIFGLFEYGVVLDNKEVGHISINIKSKSGTTNIVDEGYGVSQILPVLGQMWWATRRHRSYRSRMTSFAPTILTIEQPELHLHPAHQSLLADALVGAQQSSNGIPRKNLTCIVETHSETLVNRMGELVQKGNMDHNDIQILLFEEEKGVDRITDIRISQFDKEGRLLNWPYGFFQPELR